MDFGFFTRFYRFAPGATLTRLQEEAKMRKHKLHLVRPTDVRLKDGKAGVVATYLHQSWQRMDLLIPLLRGDDDYGWCVVDELEAKGQKIIRPTRLPHNNREEMAKLCKATHITIPPTYICNRGQVWKERQNLPWPMVIKARVQHGQRLVRKIPDWTALDACLHEFDNVIEEPLYLIGRQALTGEYVSVLVLADQTMGAHIRQDGLKEFSPAMRKMEAHERLTPTVLTKTEIDMVVRARKMYGVLFAGVDFIRTETGPLILEVNTGPSLAVYERMGAPQAAKKIVDLLEFLALKK